MTIKRFFYLSLLLFFGSWFLLSLQGLRGSDHYWYWAAVRSIVELGEFGSNTVFPASAFTVHYVNSPFIHNIPQVYLAAIPSYFLGYKWGWSVFNLLCILGGFYVFYLILLRLGIFKDKALFVLSIWMLIPINVWMSFQPNSEAFVSLLVILVVYFLILIEKKYSAVWLILLISSLLLLVITRINFAILILLLPFIFLGNKNNKLFKSFVVCICIVLVGLFINQKVFPSASKGSLVEALNMTQENPYAAPMLGFYNTQNPEFDIKQFLSSVPNRIYNLFSVQFFNKFNYIFYSFYNLMTLCLLFIVLKKNNQITKYNYLQKIYFLLLITHLFTAFIFQNQFRYLFTILSSSVLFFYFVTSEINFFDKILNNIKISIFLPIGLIIFFCISSFIFVKKLKSEANEHEMVVMEIKDFIKKNNVQENDNIFLSSQNSLFSFAFFPRKVLSYNIKKLPTDFEQEIMFKNIKPKWFINNSDLVLGEFESNLSLKFQKRDSLTVLEYNAYRTFIGDE